MKPYQYFWQLIKYRPKYYLADIVSFTMSALAGTLVGLILRAFFNGLTGDAGFRLSTGQAVFAQIGQLLLVTGMMIAANLAFAAFQYRGMALMIRNIMARLLEMPASRPLPLKKDGTRMSSGEVMSTFRDDTELMLIAIVLIDDLTGFGLAAIISFGVMFSISPTVTLGTFLPLALVIWLSNYLGRWAKKYRQQQREATTQVTGIIADIFNNTQAIKVAHAEDRIINHFRKLNDNRREAMVKDVVIEKLIDALGGGTIDIGVGFILLFAAGVMNAGTFTIGDFALFASYIWPVTQMMRLVGAVITRYKQVSVSSERLEELMQGMPAGSVVAHHPIYEDGNLPSIPFTPKTAAHHLEKLSVRGLSFVYAGTSDGIHDISFDLPHGSLTVITGRIGSGKSTLLKVLLGLLPADSGDISWNGMPVTDPANFFSPPRVAYTAQVPRLFSDSLQNNILLGLPPEKVSINHAIQLAVMESDVAEMEDGLETLVGPKGMRLSGGQIQRSAAARMFVRSADLLVFDDLSSALDVNTEQILWQRLQSPTSSLQSPSSYLIVSHRQSVLEMADHIIVLKDGRVENAGILPDLLQNSPEMQHLWQDNN
jgi:ATP-binding cassette subfamily B protein